MGDKGAVAKRARGANVRVDAGVAQPVEHQLPKLRVASSNLVARSNQISGLWIRTRSSVKMSIVSSMLSHRSPNQEVQVYDLPGHKEP